MALQKEFKKKITFGVISGWGSQAVMLVTGIASMPVYFYFLSKDELGIWILFLGTEIFINLSNFGFSNILSRQIAFEIGKSERNGEDPSDKTSYYFSISKRVSLFSGLLLFLVFTTLGCWFIYSLKLQEALLSKSIIALIIFSLAQALAARFRYFETILIGHGEVGWQNWINAIVKIAALLCFFLVLYWGFGLVGLSSIWILRSGLIGILGHYCVKWRIANRHLRGQKICFKDIGKYLRPSFDWFLMGFGAFLVLNTDQYFITYFIEASALPDYSAAFRLVIVLSTFAVTISQMSMPFASMISSAKKQADLHKMLITNTTFVMVTYLAGASIIAVYGDIIIKLWIGEGHFIGWPIIWVFCLMRALENHHVAFAQIGLSSKNEPVWGKVALISGGLNLILTYIGIKIYGLFGVALATLIAQMVTSNWYAVWKTVQMLHLDFAVYLKKSGIIWMAFFMATIIINVLLRVYIMREYLSLVLSVVICGTFYALFSFFYIRLRENTQKKDKWLYQASA